MSAEYLSYPGWKRHETLADAEAEARRLRDEDGEWFAGVRCGEATLREGGHRSLGYCRMTRTHCISEFPHPNLLRPREESMAPGWIR